MSFCRIRFTHLKFAASDADEKQHSLKEMLYDCFPLYRKNTIVFNFKIKQGI